MNDLIRTELRQSWLGMPKKFSPFDATGVLMGSYFIWDGVQHRSATSWVNIGLGAIMVYIHAQRFMFAPQDRQGLERLLTDLELTREDICP